LLVEVKINTGSLKLLDRVEQVNERAPEPINRPGHHNVEFAPLGIIEHRRHDSRFWHEAAFVRLRTRIEMRRSLVAHCNVTTGNVEEGVGVRGRVDMIRQRVHAGLKRAVEAGKAISLKSASSTNYGPARAS
jgi:hypothetical protein